MTYPGGSLHPVDAWESLFRAQVHVMRNLAADFPINDISLTEYDVLFTIARSSERCVRLRDLTGMVLLSQPSVSRLVDRLVARNFLTKTTDPHDRRSALISLTDSGYRAFRIAALSHTKRIVEIMSGALSAEEMRDLRRITAKLHAFVERIPQ